MHKERNATARSNNIKIDKEDPINNHVFCDFAKLCASKGFKYAEKNAVIGLLFSSGIYKDYVLPLRGTDNRVPVQLLHQ